MGHGRRASGSSVRHRLEEQHREVLARGIDPDTGRIRDLDFLRRCHDLIQRILETPAEEILSLRLTSGDEPGAVGTGPSPLVQRREGRELIIFRRLAEASGYGFCVTDIKGSITYANRSLCRLLAEHDPEELVGRSISACYPEEVQEAFAINIIPTVVKNGQWVGELPLRSASGQRTPTLQNIFLVHGEAGAAPYLGNLIIDITDRTRVEEALRQSEERYRSLIENLRDAVFSVDSHGTITFISKAIEGFTGFRPEEIVGRAFREFLYQDDREELERQYQELLHGMQSGPYEYRILTKSVDVRWVRSSSRPVLADGRVVGVTGVLTDITTTKRAEQALQRSEEKFSQAFRLSPDSMFIYRLVDGEVLEANEGFLRVTGLERSDAIGRSVSALQYWAHAGRRDAFEHALAETGLTESDEGALRLAGGRLLSVWMSARKIELEGVPCAICVARDITNQRRADEAIRIQRDLALDLRTAPGLEEAVRLCVQAAVAITETDAGAFYRIDREAGGLELVHATGLSPAFVSRTRHIVAGSPVALRILEGQPIHGGASGWVDLGGEPGGGEGLRAAAIVPVVGSSRVVGALAVASHIRGEVPERIRGALEAVAAQIGHVVVQAEATAALRDSERIHHLISGAMDEAVAWHRLVYNQNAEPVDYELVDANPAFARLAHASREMLIGRTSREVYGGEKPFALDTFRRVAGADDVVSFEAPWPAGGPDLRVRAFAPRPGHFIAIFAPDLQPWGRRPAESGSTPE